MSLRVRPPSLLHTHRFSALCRSISDALRDALGENRIGGSARIGGEMYCEDVRVEGEQLKAMSLAEHVQDVRASDGDTCSPWATCA